MDLEQLKNELKNDEAFNKTVEQAVINKILENKNKGLLNKLIKYEGDALKLMPLYALFFLVMSLSILIHGELLGKIWVLMIIVVVGVNMYWAKYLVKYLKGIDMGVMSVTQVNRMILKYREYIIRHTVIAGVFVPIYLTGWLHFYFKINLSENASESFTFYYTIGLLIFAIALFLIIMWSRYFKNISEIRKGLKEIEDLENQQ